MIEKLKSKIFILMMTSLSIIIIGIIILFAVFNCTNTIRASKVNIERVTRMREGPGGQDLPIKPQIQTFINEENERVDTHVKTTIVISIVASAISLIAIYWVSKKVSGAIVKPVYDTFEKQKQFISDASHELKTPLAVIEANADVLENEVGSNKWLTYIQKETESMDKLINELLLLAKVENVDDVKNYEKFNLSTQIETSTAIFESMAYEKQTRIISNIQNDIYINGNKQDFEHIVSTLVDNAIKHSGEGKAISVDFFKEKNNIILLVKNYGEAIPENQQDKIFERFYRIDKSRNRNEKRYGLGLAIAKSIVEKYNGKIEVECKDGITIFKVTMGTEIMVKYKNKNSMM